MWLQCPAGCLFQDFKVSSFNAWNPNVIQAKCPKCKKVYARNRFGLPGITKEGPTRMPVPTQPFSPQEHAQRIIRMTAPVARSMSELNLRDGRTMREIVAEILQQITKSRAPDLVSRVCQQLKNSSLTVNFPTVIIYDLLGDTRYKNFWQVPRGATPPGYGHDREATELALHPLRPLAPSNLRVQGTPAFPVKEYGTAADRPISAGLNIAYYYGGAGPMYGTSYLVLRDQVRQRCTFTAGDSLEHHWKKKLFLSSVGTADNLVNVLYHMSRPALECVAGLALGTSAPRVGGPPISYVEAQIFGGLDITTDVRAMVIDEDELKYWLDASDDEIPALFKGVGRSVREHAVKSLRTTIELFCEKHMIQLQYIKSGKRHGQTLDPLQVYQPIRFSWQK